MRKEGGRCTKTVSLRRVGESPAADPEWFRKAAEEPPPSADATLQLPPSSLHRSRIDRSPTPARRSAGSPRPSSSTISVRPSSSTVMRSVQVLTPRAGPHW